jgi:DNA-binding transcriptional regulator YhcF (GntR family)
MATNEVAAGANGGASENAVQAAKLNTSEDSTSANARKNPWRDHLKVHPAADLFPLMPPDELKVLAEDIRKNGLRSRVAVIDGPDGEPILLDGRNRLDAMDLVALKVVIEDIAVRVDCSPDFDPYGYVVSANIHRRHLTAKQKDALLATLIKAQPTKSNRQLAKLAAVSHPHVAKVRTELEQSGDVETVTTSVDTKGRKQPTKKKKRRTEDDLAKDIAAKRAKTQPEQGSPDLTEEANQLLTAVENLGNRLHGPETMAEIKKAGVADDTHANPILTAWDAANDAQRQEFVKLRGAEIGRAGDQADPFAIPDFLRRTAP